jgi:hypothetical protein
MHGLDICEILMREHQSMLYTFVRSTVTDFARVDNVCHEAFILGYKHLSEPRHEEPFPYWKKNIPQRRVFEVLRRQQFEMPVYNQVKQAVKNMFITIGKSAVNIPLKKIRTLRTFLNGLHEQLRSTCELQLIGHYVRQARVSVDERSVAVKPLNDEQVVQIAVVYQVKVAGVDGLNVSKIAHVKIAHAQTAIEMGAQSENNSLRMKVGTGSSAPFYQELEFNRRIAAERIEPLMNFFIPIGVTIDPLLHKHEYSSRGDSFIEPVCYGNHCIKTVSNVGIRLWTNDMFVTNKWTEKRFFLDLGFTQLKVKKHPVVIEYNQLYKHGAVNMSWSAMKNSPATLIPTTQLYHEVTP